MPSVSESLRKKFRETQLTTASVMQPTPQVVADPVTVAPAPVMSNNQYSGNDYSGDYNQAVDFSGVSNQSVDQSFNFQSGDTSMSQFQSMAMCQQPSMGDCGCESSLDVSKICARCAKICSLRAKEEWVEELSANRICSQHLMSGNAEFGYLRVNEECAQSVASVNVSAGNLSANTATLGMANIGSLCVTNLQAPNFAICNTYRAYLGVVAPYTYTLGSNLTFNAVLDDPSGMTSQVPTSHFTAPVAGYYSVELFINAATLAGANLIVGTPVASLSIQVNGISRQSILTPFLAFSPEITDTLSASLLLAAGDQVTAVLNVEVQDPTLGVINYVGTMLVSGGPLVSTVDPSTFSLTLLSTLCTSSGPGAACPTIQPVVIPCQPVSINCQPVSIGGCSPCGQ